ncbi:MULTISPECIES: ATP-dependent DNA helicase RecG [Pseudomonas]|jgi:ATP-dependent DNA helicase RecG|uniref:ATP-dependent DNA helicase RecG n=2 Tax=Pseudomonas putida group TaxID=136845 RepID=Q88C73_PSEPK|nr:MULTISPECIES: ATP-dependent DNA helicase RecG [Pseudomonas]AAN70875.1 junction-specific ATP-dependent DNA helicase [Pseudomonas putida KT2440]KMU93158.1 ATP-dependent DNA helicase RecG [Pseudomonas putida]KMY28011.1 ATP-dependent DNA helicase RecG [Pseudomonas putida]MBP2840190.1 ATP-dependent DNA helicase RecG [Pseudomonas sp. PNP]MCE0862014.1 ATP-dependent DNA helicase RecG [Pseudomonas alloputida]
MSELSKVPVTVLKGVGEAMAEKLAKVGLENLQDVLFHLPLRYQDRTRVVPIGQLRPGQDAVIEGVVSGADVTMGKRRSLVVRLGDGSGVLTLRFYHFSNAQKEGLKRGTHLRCYGEARPGASGLEIYHPEYRALNGNEPPPPVEQTLTPIYPSTEGLTQQRLRLLCQQSLALLGPRSLPDWLPDELARDYQLAPLDEAIRYLHNPPADADLDELAEGQHWAQHRLAFEELLTHQLSQQRLRESLRSLRAPVLPRATRLQAQYLANLGFQPTGAQQRVANEIAYDLSQHEPMMRLVQGDVGAGKTVVAALAALQALEAGYQVALMAPTEILAEQHYITFKRWLEPLGIEVAWLAGKLKGKARAASLEQIANGAPMVVGTHALFQEEVRFKHLALAIIDEQHRFGVQQRLALRRKGVAGELCPHQLIMTATPIPRTLAMSAYADLDTSVLDELPPGRTPVNTVLVADSRRFEVVERVRAACAEGRQAYWVCTLIEESEELTCQAAESTYEELGSALGELKVGLIHGRMKPAEKAEIMAEFKAGNLQLLVATTVIEVGVDVPNASLMIIENPERLGLAQLHQLRGRVGRGSAVSHCVLLYHPPLSQIGRERLGIMRETNDGFIIAEKDLELRGPGEMLGTRQTGLLQFKVADLMRDADLLPAVRDAAQALVSRWPEHVSPLLDRWLRHGQQYGQV